MCFEESKSKVFDERLMLLLCLGGIWVEKNVIHSFVESKTDVI